MFYHILRNLGQVMCVEERPKRKIPHMPPAPQNWWKTSPCLLKPVKQFTAQVFVEFHPGQIKPAVWNEMEDKYEHGFTPVVHCRVARVSCKMVQLKWTRIGGQKKMMNDPHVLNLLKQGDLAEAVFEPQ